MRRQNKNRSEVWKQVTLGALCLVLAVVLFGMIFATAFLNRTLNQMNRVDPDKESLLGSSEAEQLLGSDPEIETIDPDSTETLPNLDDITFPTETTPTTGEDDPSQPYPVRNIRRSSISCW